MDHNEPVLCNGEIAGHVTAGSFWGRDGSVDWIVPGVPPEAESGRVSVPPRLCSERVEGQGIAAEISLEPFIDPESMRMLG